MQPTTKFQLAQMVRCTDGPHRGRVGFVLALGERSISVNVYHTVTGEFLELEQQRVEVWEGIAEPAADVERRLHTWRITRRIPCPAPTA